MFRWTALLMMVERTMRTPSKTAINCWQGVEETQCFLYWRSVCGKVSWLSWYKTYWAVWVVAGHYKMAAGGGERATCMKDGERFVAK